MTTDENEAKYGQLEIVEGELFHDKNWVYFATQSHIEVQNKLNELSPRIDGVHAIISTQKWYHVWAREGDKAGGRWEVKTGDASKLLSSLTSLISNGHAVPVNFSSAGKTVYWLEKIG